jgi:hypothetical protein
MRHRGALPTRFTFLGHHHRERMYIQALSPYHRQCLHLVCAVQTPSLNTVRYSILPVLYKNRNSLYLILLQEKRSWKNSDSSFVKNNNSLTSPSQYNIHIESEVRRNSGRQNAATTKFCKMAPYKTVDPSVRNVLHVTLLEPRMFRLLVSFCEISASLAWAAVGGNQKKKKQLTPANSSWNADSPPPR